MQDMYYTNPHDPVTDHKNWERWNIGEEDGSRGLKPRGKSAAYRHGYDMGRSNATNSAITKSRP